MGKSSTCNLIEEFRHKAGCWITASKADKILKQLEKLIDEKDWWKLFITYQNFRMGEVATELYDVCKELVIKYK